MSLGEHLCYLTAFSFKLQAESSAIPAGDSNVAEVLASQKGTRRRPRDAPAGKGSKLCLLNDLAAYGGKRRPQHVW